MSDLEKRLRDKARLFGSSGGWEDLQAVLLLAADRIAELDGRWTDKDCLRFSEAYHNMCFDGSKMAEVLVARVRRGLAALRENSVPDGTQPEEVKP